MGNRTNIKVVKNKIAPPFRIASVDIMYGEGISKAGDILDCAVEAKIIEKAGSWYSYDGNRIGQGRENTIKYLKENPELYQFVEKTIREEFAGGLISVPMDSDEEDMDEADDEGVEE